MEWEKRSEAQIENIFLLASAGNRKSMSKNLHIQHLLRNLSHSRHKNQIKQGWLYTGFIPSYGLLSLSSGIRRVRETVHFPILDDSKRF